MCAVIMHPQVISAVVFILLQTACHGALEFFEDIEKPKSDDRLYRAFTLENGMKVLVISDPKTDTAAAALQIGIGGLTDPWDMQGLAHFTEHMLFIASEKYPEINGYAKFVVGNGGSWNGFTQDENVYYTFSVKKGSFVQALDRFAQFFISPLFNEAAVNREIGIVESEYFFRNKQDDWRNWFLRSARTKSMHDMQKFYPGNRESLETIPKKKGLVPRDEVVKYYNKWYSSNLMTLAILGSESLDDLTELVKERFGAVVKQNVSAQSWSTPWGKEHLQRYVKAEQIEDKEELSFEFPLKDFRPLYRSKPGRYVSYVINDESKGSLASYLKKMGWAEKVEFGAYTVATGIGYSTLVVKLTKEGQLKEKEVSVAVFQYLDMLRKEGPKERIFKEIQKISDLEFGYKEKSKTDDAVTDMVENLRRYPFKEVLSGAYRLWEYDPKAITDLLNQLVPENVMIYRYSKNAFKEGELDKKEKWYGVRYSDEPIDPKVLDAIKTAGANEAFKLPGPNEFIAEATELKKADPENGPLPELVKSDNHLQAWYLQEKEFRVPKAVVKFRISSSYANTLPSHASLLQLFVRLLSDSLNEDLFAATKAGISYSIYESLYGIMIDISGFEDKQSALVGTIMESLMNFEPEPVRFVAVKDKYIRELKNFAVKQALRQNIAYLYDSMVEKNWSEEQKLLAAEPITLDMIMDYKAMFLSRTHVEMLCVGDLTREIVLSAANTIQNALKSAEGFEPMPKVDLLPLRQTFVPEGKSFLHQKVHPVEGDNSILIHLQMFEKSMKNDLIAALIPNMMKLEMFTQLRTQEELGYVASTWRSSFSSGVNGINLLIQTVRLPGFVTERVDAFLSRYEEMLTNMTDDEFSDRKKSLATLRFEKPKSINDRQGKYWPQIEKRFYNFDWENLEKGVLDTITKEDVLTAYQTYISPSSSTRKRLLFYVTGTKATDAGYNPEENCKNSEITCMDNAHTFKEQQRKYPFLSPFKTIEELEAECPRDCA